MQNGPSIGIATGQSRRLVDPGSATVLAVAAERLGYSSVWTFDTAAGRDVGDVVSTLEALLSETTRIVVGAGLRADACAETLDRIAALQICSSRIVVARPTWAEIGPSAPGRTLQVWDPGRPDLRSWAEGWLVDLGAFDRSVPSMHADRTALVVRLPVDDAVARLVAEIADLHAAGATEIVLDVSADIGLDQALDLYARIAEAVEVQLDRRTP